MGGKMFSIIFLFSLFACDPTSSQNIFELLNILGDDKLSHNGKIIITTFKNMLPAEKSDNQPITIVHTADNAATDFKDDMTYDFDFIMPNGLDSLAELASNTFFIKDDNPSKIMLIDKSFLKTLTKLTKEPNTDPKLMKTVQDQIKYILEEVKSVFSNDLASTEVCVGQKTSAIITKGCKADCEENKERIRRSRARRSLSKTLNTINAIMPFRTTMFDAIDDFIFQEFDDANKVTQSKVGQVHSKEIGDNIDKCSLEDNIACINTFLQEVVTCPHRATISQDRLQSSIQVIIQYINKLFLSLTDVALQHGTTAAIDSKMDTIESPLHEALDDFVHIFLFTESELETEPFVFIPTEKLEPTENTLKSHVVGRKLPMMELLAPNTILPKMIPIKKILAKFIPNEDSSSEYLKIFDNNKKENIIEDTIKDVFQNKKSAMTQNSKPISSKLSFPPDFAFNLGKLDSNDFMEVMSTVMSIMEGVNKLINIAGAHR